ncbi:DUF974-domain-containing protein [Hymenopellis radicata]|nr:DUF974-domain-containing protein [Hymenopellis radicata]
MDGPSHLLSLKVMRVSRPSLASAWQPFYSSSPSFSAHSTASIMSLQGNTPLSGHPKTLRDFTQATELLTLPASFGAIQLGETFSSCLCVNNEAQVDVESVKMTVEMQTVTAKVLLAEFGGPDCRLSVADTLEHVIHHEIKELGQHVLACTVSYRLPPSVRISAQNQSEDSADPTLQSFRKFYKFVVANPLSVKTKVHTTRSPSAILDINQRDKVFLEVHIQNMTQEPIWFERMIFESVDGWEAQDANKVSGGREEDGLFSASMELMHPQDMRQYIYVLKPSTLTLEPPIYTPGTSIPLGRLDLSWRSSYGEPGRLLTSMLSRRIPLPSSTPKPNQPASALPPYLKRTVVASTPGSTTPSRPNSPGPGSRPGSPFKNRPASMGPARVQSPPPATQLNPLPALDVNLLVTDMDRNAIRVQHPFNVRMTLTVSTSIPFEKRHYNRVVTLAVQSIEPQGKVLPIAPPVQLTTSEPFTRIASPGMPTPTQSPTSTAFSSPVVQQRVLTSSPRQNTVELGPYNTQVLLPLPLSHAALPCNNISYCGPSAIILDPVQLVDAEGQDAGPIPQRKVHAVQEFDLTYMALRPGFTTFGGLRILLIEDKFVGVIPGMEDEVQTQQGQTAQVIKEWEVTGEVWVSSQ